MNSARVRFALSILPWVLVSGCVWVGIPEPGPPPEAVLAGTWQVIAESDTGVSQRFWVFDDNGNLVEASYVVGNVTVTEAVLAQETRVNDSSVTVQLGTASRNYLFEGVLSEDRTRADGGITVNWTFFTTTVEIDEGPASLVKQ